MTYVIHDLLAVHRQKGLEPDPTSKLEFALLEAYEGEDVYNPAAPFEWKGQAWLLARMEARDSEFSHVGFFQPADAYTSLAEIKRWRQVEVIELPLQDPFVTVVGDELIVGGVEVTERAGREGLDYRTVFYRGRELAELEAFAAGPWGMKDLRLKELPDGRILLLTRPQGEVGGRGTIGWCLLDSLEELHEEAIAGATLLQDQFIPEEWGGGKEMHILDQERVGVLAHIARFDDEGNRHYYAAVFTLNHQTGAVTPIKIIAERGDFAPGPSKRPDLADVVFSGGLLRDRDGTSMLYCGIADCEVHARRIEDPFYDQEATSNDEGYRR